MKHSPYRSLFWRLGLLLVGVQLLAAVGIVGYHLVTPHAQPMQTGTIIRETLAWWFISLLLSLVILYFAAHWLSKQIEVLTRGAQQFAHGGLDQQLSRPAAAELSDLTEALNSMAKQVEGKIHELHGQRADREAILRSMNSGVIALDRDERILNINRAAQQMFQVSGDARGRLLHEVARQADLHTLTTEALDGQNPDSIELQLTGASGYRLVASTEPLQGSDNQVRGILLLLEDVTKLRRLESMRSDFAANVSHELRTPITNIKGYVETLIDVWKDDPTQTEYFLDIIKRNSNRLASIVDDVLSLTRLENTSATTPFEYEPIRVNQLLVAVAAQFAHLAHEKDIAIEINADPDACVLGNQTLLEQAIGNLLANAISYSPSKTGVTMSSSMCLKGNEVVEILVTDEGPGIAAEHRDRVFERFYRIDKGRSRSAGGTGLGLAIVKHIVHAHHGTVVVRNERRYGSCFCITLPCESHEKTPVHTQP